MHSTTIIMPEEPKIVCPADPNYELPISIVDPKEITPEDEELLQAMAQHRPKTKFKPGDLAYLTEIPFQLRRSRGLALPRIWKVRFAISAWAYELMCVAMEHGGYGTKLGMDRAIALLERTHFDESKARNPMLYAHGYPHGIYPSTAAWLPARALRPLTFREPNVAWRTVIEEANAPYYGYDSDKLPIPFYFSVAPDDYSTGQNIGHPFLHEEAVTHAACTLGLEEHLFVPIIIGASKKPRPLDQDHDVFLPGE